MNFDAGNALTTMEAGFAALSALVVSYSFSAIGAIVLLVAGYFIAGLAERAVVAAVGSVRGIDSTLVTFFSKMVRYAILALVIVMVLGQFGVQTASIIAAMGAIGLAIGLALQGTLQNIAAGIMLLVLRPLRIGESIEVDSIAGKVEEIGLFATRLRSADGVYILAPNSTLWNKPIRNYNRNGVRRTDIEIAIANDDNISDAQRALMMLAEADGRVKAKPAPEAFVSALGESKVSVTLRFWTSDKDQQAAKVELMRKAKETIDEKAAVEPEEEPAISRPRAARAKAPGRKVA